LEANRKLELERSSGGAFQAIALEAEHVANPTNLLAVAEARIHEPSLPRGLNVRRRSPEDRHEVRALSTLLLCGNVVHPCPLSGMSRSSQ
jgi:hypothetical protein